MWRSEKTHPLLRYMASLLSLEQYNAQQSIYRLLGKQIDAIVRQKSDISCAQLVLKPLNPFFPPSLSREILFSCSSLNRIKYKITTGIFHALVQIHECTGNVMVENRDVISPRPCSSCVLRQTGLTLHECKKSLWTKLLKRRRKVTAFTPSHI